jgi:hypothetical protein
LIVDALVGFGYPFAALLDMTFSELMEWQTAKRDAS